ncbi:MAG: hypothetical protein QOE47_1103 [Pyrinomonadaceae bacterium]|nr:hypothetical protein [Pyrinomonadaceae bacterium]
MCGKRERMPDDQFTTRRWRVVGHSVRGASHERAGTPNQDAIHWLPASSGDELPLVLALADGHGSAKSFRSETGARLAVETAAAVVRDFLKVQTESLSATKRAAEEWLPGALVRGWQEAVAAHLAAHPLSPDELDPPHASRRAVAAVNTDSSNSLVAYGTTLLVAAVTESFILYLQLGDGEILNVSAGGEVSKPLPEDARLFANETTSLCSPDAWHDFRVCFQVVSHAPPSLILLSTDGYPNSFLNATGFLKVGSDILAAIRAGGLDAVNENIAAWLTESTRAGSGDDATLGLIFAEDAPQHDARASHTKHDAAGQNRNDAKTGDACGGA